VSSLNPPLPNRRKILSHFQRNDPALVPVIRSVGEFQLRRNRNYFRVLCKSIVSQQISTSAADTIYRRFQGLFEGRPTPQKILRLPDDRLRSCGLSRQKTAYIRDLSARFQDKVIRPRRLPWQDNEEVIATLTQVHGIGRWTAEMFLIFSLNRMDVLPVDDLGLRNAVKKIYDLPQNPSAGALREMGRRWHPFQTVATWYAWRSLNADIVNY